MCPPLSPEETPECWNFQFPTDNFLKEPVAKEPVYWNDFTLWDNYHN